MKLQRLDITGFGRLRNFRADFGPGLNVVRGANESGKTTLQRAIRAALYGLDAGGPGRPVERSDWARWQPWSSGKYGLSLTYTLDNSEEIRVAARWDKRPPRVEVRAMGGGGDITNQMRHGRLVAPGLVHLGIDESVFCATACLGDESLRVSSSDAPTQHARRLHDALERIADSGGDATTQEALARIDEARQRIGNERRTSYGLGQVAQRLRQLESLLTDARRKNAAVLSEQARLQDLEARAKSAAARELESEIQWLAGKVAALDLEIAEVVALGARVEELRMSDSSRQTGVVPVHQEERILSLGAELHAASVTEARAAAEWESMADEVAAIQHRTEQIRDGLAALGPARPVDHSMTGEVAELRTALRVEREARERLLDEAQQSRTVALQREIAASGVGFIPPAEAEATQTLVDTALCSGQALWLTMLAGLLGSGIGLYGFARLSAWWLLAAAGGLTALLWALFSEVARQREVATAKQRLRDLYPDQDLRTAGLTRLRTRIPSLIAIHAEMARQEVNAGIRDSQRDAATTRIHVLEEAAVALAQNASLDLNTHAFQADKAEAALQAVEEAIDIAERRQELDRELVSLAERSVALDRIRLAAEIALAECQRIEAILRKQLSASGIDDNLPVTLAIAAFRDACTKQRNRAAAGRELDASLARLTRLGDVDSLLARRAEYARELRARGVDTDEPDGTWDALDPAALAKLEREVDYARRENAAAGAEARELRGRLAVLIENSPPLADIEDEFAALTTERQRYLRQLAALDYAAQLIEKTTVAVHRTLAPLLSKSLSAQLGSLTDGRYENVEVDAERFAVSLLSEDRPEYIPLDQVSHGTRDQVSLLMRVALAETLGTGEHLPLLLDEPLLTSDPQRRTRALEFLVELARDQQVVINANDAATVDALRLLNPELTVIDLDSLPAVVVLDGNAAAEVAG